LSHPETSPGEAVVLAQAFAELGMREAELMCWECAARLDPSERAFPHNRCNALGQLRRFEEQLAGLEEALIRFPDDDAIAAQRVQALVWLGRLEEATARAREVIQRWPAQVDVVDDLSWLLLLDGAGERVDHAEALLARAQELGVSSQATRLFRGAKILLRFRRGQHAEGLKEVRALIEEERSEWGRRFPKLVPADQRSYHGTHRLLEAMFLAALGRIQEARAVFRQGLQHGPDPMVVELARDALNAGRA
jgi:tetratricopeptide (TPR) repeat protein